MILQILYKLTKCANSQRFHTYHTYMNMACIKSLNIMSISVYLVVFVYISGMPISPHRREWNQDLRSSGMGLATKTWVYHFGDVISAPHYPEEPALRQHPDKWEQHCVALVPWKSFQCHPCQFFPQYH